MSAAASLSHDFKLPPELVDRVNSGLLEVLKENWTEKTVEFHVPSFRSEDLKRRITAYSVVWIHPDHNAEFCHYFAETPGDLPNFYVSRETSDSGSELLDINSVDDLVAWLDDPSLL